MKWLHIGYFIPESTNVAQADGFALNGCDVVRYDYRKKAVELDGQITHHNPKRDDDLIKFCQDLNPDFIFFSKCNDMDECVVHECNKIGTTILWYMDFKTNVNSELLAKMKHCNYVFCSRYDGIDAAHSVGNMNTYRIQDGFDPEVHIPTDIVQAYDVTFIGDMNRFGRTAFKNNSNILNINGVHNESHAATVCMSKINLNFTEGDGVSHRLYKLLAAKGFVLTQPWKNMTDDWIIGKDFDIFNTPEELNLKIEYYLARPKLRNKIANHGYETALKYDHVHFAKRILDVVDPGRW